MKKFFALSTIALATFGGHTMGQAEPVVAGSSGSNGVLEKAIKSKKKNSSGFHAEDDFVPRTARLVDAPHDLRPLITKAAEKHDIAPRLLEAVAKQESRFDPKAVSPAGAQGLMQIMPKTQKDLGVSNPFDAEESLDAGARYLRMNLDRFDGDLALALAAYNAGPGNVEKYRGIPPFRETRNYVRTIISDIRKTG